MDLAAEHWIRALILAEDAWPELRATDAQQDLQALSVYTNIRNDAALLRDVAGILRKIADGSPVPPQEWFIEVAGIFRDIAARLLHLHHQAAAPTLENIRHAKGSGAVGDRAVDELVQGAAAMKAAAAHYAAAADDIDRAATAAHP